MMIKIHRILLSSVVILIALIVFAPTVRAAEINPDPDSISYGSTSESSASLEINPNGTSVSNSNLASTGDPARIIEAVAIVFLVTGVISIVIAIRRQKYGQK